MGLVDLPFELMTNILLYLSRKEQSTIAKLSKILVEPARALLYASVDLTDPKCHETLWRYPHLRSYVKHAKWDLAIETSVERSTRGSPLPALQRPYEDCVPALVPQMPTLRVWSIEFTHWSSQRFRSVSSENVYMARLTRYQPLLEVLKGGGHAALTSVTLGGPIPLPQPEGRCRPAQLELLKSLFRLSSLRKLRIQGWTFWEYEELMKQNDRNPDSEPFSTTSRITELHVEFCSSERDTIRWMLQSTTRLKKFTWDSYTFDLYYDVDFYETLRQSCPDLEELCIPLNVLVRFTPKHVSVRPHACKPLEPLRKLRRLRLNTQSLDRNYAWTRASRLDDLIPARFSQFLLYCVAHFTRNRAITLAELKQQEFSRTRFRLRGFRATSIADDSSPSQWKFVMTCTRI